MKTQTPAKTFRDAVAWAASYTAVNGPTPIVSGLVLTAADDRLTLSGFDYERSGRVEVRSEVGEPGKVVVSGRLLADIAKTLPDRPVDLELDPKTLKLTCGAGEFHLPLMPVEDYPALPQMPPRVGAFGAGVFAAAVAQAVTAHADAKKALALPALGAVHFKALGEQVELYTTDSYRAAYRRAAWEAEKTEDELELLVPWAALAEAAKAFDTGEEVEVFAGADAGLVGLRCGGRQITVRLLDASFPKVAKMFRDFPAVSLAKVDRKELIGMIKRVRVMLEPGAPLRLEFSPGVRSLTLAAGKAGRGKRAQESMPADIDGELMYIMFNPDYLLEAVSSVQGQAVYVQMVADLKPAIFTGAHPREDPEGVDYQHMLMAVRDPG